MVMAKKAKKKAKKSAKKKASGKKAVAKSSKKTTTRKKKKSRRALPRRSKGQKLNAVRVDEGKVNDIQQYASAHAADIAVGSASEAAPV
jgi:sRNA-binding protein